MPQKVHVIINASIFPENGEMKFTKNESVSINNENVINETIATYSEFVDVTKGRNYKAESPTLGGKLENTYTTINENYNSTEPPTDYSILEDDNAEKRFELKTNSVNDQNNDQKFDVLLSPNKHSMSHTEFVDVTKGRDYAGDPLLSSAKFENTHSSATNSSSPIIPNMKISVSDKSSNQKSSSIVKKVQFEKFLPIKNENSTEPPTDYSILEDDNAEKRFELKKSDSFEKLMELPVEELEDSVFLRDSTDSTDNTLKFVKQIKTLDRRLTRDSSVGQFETETDQINKPDVSNSDILDRRLPSHFSSGESENESDTRLNVSLASNEVKGNSTFTNSDNRPINYHKSDKPSIFTFELKKNTKTIHKNPSTN